MLSYTPHCFETDYHLPMKRNEKPENMDYFRIWATDGHASLNIAMEFPYSRGEQITKPPINIILA